MGTAVLLAMQDLGEWAASAETKSVPGGALPYGMQHVGDHFDLAWSDRQRRGLWRRRLPRAVGGAVRRGAPGLQGSVATCYAVPMIRQADVVLSVFENSGVGFARLQTLSRRARAVPHVMLTCWLAQDCQEMSSRQLRSVRRSVPGVSKLAVFSENQVPILQEHFELEPDRLSVVPFGVDTDHYTAPVDGGPPGGEGLVAVGSDSRRDYATLFEAVRIADVPLVVACQPRNLKGLVVPPQVTVLEGAYDDEYRRLLHRADLVVTPTVAPAYPCGQSVVLEAMSMGAATLTTDSPAMRDYVEDGVNGLLMPVGDPEAVAHRITELLGDADRLRSIGVVAAETVRQRFGLAQMWDAVSALLLDVSDGRGIDACP